MKKLFALVAVLAMPALALGASTAVFSPEVGGSSALLIPGPVAPGGLALTLDMVVSSPDGALLDGVSVGLDVTSPYGGIGVMNATGGLTLGTLFLAGDSVTPLPPFPGMDIQNAALGGTYLGESYFKTFGTAAPGAGTLLSSLPITNTMPLAIGDVVTITASSGALAAPPLPQCIDNTNGGCGAIGNTLTITITPEPASALLLLAAVPFFRRRR